MRGAAAPSGSPQIRPTDWRALYRRVEGAQMAVERGFEATPEEKRQILRARAKMLAATGPDAAPTACLEVLVFSLADQHYGIETLYVREVYPLKDLTPLPCTPPFVLGILNVHGQIISLIDLKQFFGLPVKGLAEINRVIILSTDAMEFGVLADAIVGIQAIPLQDIQVALPTLTGMRAGYLRGVTPEQLVVLDAQKLLSDTDLVVREDIEI